jgi:hypothetical protein
VLVAKLQELLFMEKQIISALFDNYDDAAQAVGRLKVAGISEADISLVGGSQQMRSSGSPAVGRPDDDTAEDAGKGAAIGGVLGGGAGLLAGLGLLAIPGLGPVVAAGWLASTLLGATAGAATGGLIGALMHAGVPEEDAHAYAEGIRRGSTLVTARVDQSLLERARDILSDEGTVNMGKRVTAWRKEGWNGRYSERS